MVRDESIRPRGWSIEAEFGLKSVGNSITNIYKAAVAPIVTEVNDVAQVFSDPSKANFGQIAGVIEPSGLTASTQTDVKNPYDVVGQASAVALVYGGVSAFSGIGASVGGDAAAVSAEGSAPAAAAAGGGAGGFATPAALTTEVPDYALNSALDYSTSALNEAPTFALTGEESTSLVSEAATSALSSPDQSLALTDLNPFGGSTPLPDYSLSQASAPTVDFSAGSEPANLVTVDPTSVPFGTGVTAGAGGSSTGILSTIFDDASSAVQTGWSWLTKGAAIDATVQKLIQTIFPTKKQTISLPSVGGAGVTIGGATLSGAGSGGGVGSGGSSVTNSSSNIGGIPSIAIYGMIAVVALLLYAKKIK